MKDRHDTSTLDMFAGTPDVRVPKAHERILQALRRRQWLTYEELAEEIGAKSADSVSTMMRTLTRPEFGGFAFECRERFPGTQRRIREYRLLA